VIKVILDLLEKLVQKVIKETEEKKVMLDRKDLKEILEEMELQLLLLDRCLL
jgi:hypothetical protein